MCHAHSPDLRAVVAHGLEGRHHIALHQGQRRARHHQRVQRLRRRRAGAMVHWKPFLFIQEVNLVQHNRSSPCSVLTSPTCMAASRTRLCWCCRLGAIEASSRPAPSPPPPAAAAPAAAPGTELPAAADVAGWRAAADAGEPERSARASGPGPRAPGAPAVVIADVAASAASATAAAVVAARASEGAGLGGGGGGLPTAAASAAQAVRLMSGKPSCGPEG
jgi:hypothetical protein